MEILYCDECFTIPYPVLMETEIFPVAATNLYICSEKNQADYLEKSCKSSNARSPTQWCYYAQMVFYQTAAH